MFSIRRQRSQRGSLIADAPLALWLLLIGLAIPMIDLVTISLRSTLLLTTARDAAHAAAKAESFETATSPDAPSAKEIAYSEAMRIASSFSEINVNSVRTLIVATNLSNGQSTRQEEKLATPADTSAFIYNVEVEVSGEIRPLLNGTSGLFGGIPGLTAAVPLVCVASEFCENPQGLDK